MGNVYFDILKSVFPKGYSYAFAYGSNVYKQLHHNNSKRAMIDFVLAVDDSLSWHKENIERNPKHYSFLKYGGASKIAKIQDSFGAKVYYNTLIPTESGMIKYGIVSRENFIADLLDWDSLYLSGRLHKPVKILSSSGEQEIKTALKVNLLSALHTALLLLPEGFTEQQLYLTIAGISYCGDFRMVVGENRNKVQNIVSAQMSDFRNLYSSLVTDLKDHALLNLEKSYGEQDLSYNAKYLHLSQLPKKLQMEIMSEWNKDGRSRDLEDVLRAAAQDPDSRDIILKGIQNIVGKSSFYQGLKGILTAGATKSIFYSFEKLKKMRKSINR